MSVSFAAILARAIFAQGGEAAPKFGIADVHARPPNSILAMRSGFSRGRYEIRNATMVDLVRTAWGVDADRVLGGPGWLELDRFDVVATAPAGATAETLHTMLRGLLAERFQLVAHKDMSELPAYGLMAGKKLQLKKSAGAEETGCRLQGKSPQGRAANGEPVAFACRNMTMAALANTLPDIRGASGYLFNYKVVDRTGLEGAWDFDVKWSMRAPGPPKAGAGETITMFDAFEKQLGLKLELIKIPTPVVVVDRVNEKPTDNLPEVAEKLPAPPMEFEVADIKPEDPDDGIRGSSVAIRHGGLVRVDMTLKGLIQEAWNSLNPDRIVGGPKSLDETRFEVLAKIAAPELAPSPGVFNGADIDVMRIMLRALLRDRFKLETHMEDRPVAGYVLTAAKPKLPKADPANRPGCKEGPGRDGKDPRILNPMASRLVTCRNMTLTQFAAELRNIADLYLEPYPPVADLTGIEGRYDLTINFSPPAALQAAGGQSVAGGDGAASEPNGAISLFEALSRQLGLKLESRKVTAPVLVIDHVEEMPTAN